MSVQDKINKQKTRNQYDFGGAINQGYDVIIKSYNPIKDSISVDALTGITEVNCYHPAVYASSWIRCTPESGVVTLIKEGTSSKSVIRGTISPSPDKRIDAYYKDQDLFHPLRGGEVEIQSAGYARSFYGKEPVLEQRGGIVRSWHDQLRLQHGVKAPLHIKEGFEKEAGKLSDETRFGVVHRYMNGNLVFEQPIKLLDLETFAKEYLRELTNSNQKLESLRIGDVINDSGNIEMSSKGKALRYKHILFTAADAEISMKIDEDGNINIILPDTAKEFNFFNNGEKLIFSTKKDFNMESREEHINIKSKKNTTIQCKELKIGNADDVVVLGNQLKALLIQLINLILGHTHIGNLGTPTAITPANIPQFNNLLTNFLNNDAILSDFIKISKVSPVS